MKTFFALVLLVAGVCGQGVDDIKQINVPECGSRASLKNHDKIVGGVISVAGDWNWMTILKSNNNFFCGSSLINSGWLVTAAHCTAGKTASQITAEIGLHDRNAPESWVQFRKISKIVDHESYNSFTMSNDVSLLKLDTPVTYNFYIGPVCINTLEDDFANNRDYAYATGWGTLNSGGSTSQFLREVDLLVRDNAGCKADGGLLVNTDTMICAGVKGDNKDTCQGDSGGPLVIANPKNSNKYTLIGITSWGRGCGDVGVYARVQTFAKWISDKLLVN